jgi:hypothetical protein
MLDFIICGSTLGFMFIPKISAHKKLVLSREVTASESNENSK